MHKATIMAMALATGLGCTASEEEVGSLELGVTVERAANPSGWAESMSLTGTIDRDNPFFQERGTNGRTCETCHDSAAGWTVTPELAEQLFASTDGLAAIFRPHDASLQPQADHSEVDDREDLYRLVTSRGLFHTPNQVPDGADFELFRIDDPYDSSTRDTFLRFRRPNSISNEGMTQTVTWNGVDAPPRVLLEVISNAATQFHGQQPVPLSVEDQQAMADFMETLIHAQAEDLVAGRLDVDGARGGVETLASETFVVGENDPASPGFDRQVFTLYGAWAGLSGSDRNLARAAIARGEALFNTMEFDIRGVAGFNDELGSSVIRGTCSSCHSAPNIGHHPVFRPMNIGTSSDNMPGASELPRLHVRNSATGEEVRVTDLGLAIDTGRWADLGKFSVPRLRGLASRAPYFHNGSAESLRKVLDFYQSRFDINFSGSQRDDLLAFLSAL